LTLQPEAHACFVRRGTIRTSERNKRRDHAG
jgi:hypothetical protein